MIRLMRTDDIDGAMRLKAAAGWNQTEHDWANVLALEPEGCWVWEQEGQVAGTTTAICYGQDLAWIGMVLVLPEHRGKGIARGLMEHALRWLEGRGVRQVKLDATDMGRPLYEKLGFRDERLIERWGKQEDGSQKTEVGMKTRANLPVEPIAAMDRESFGVDRSALIARLLQVFRAGAWEAKGFCLGRPGSNAYFVGPCAAAEAGVAGRLVRAVMETAGAASYFWDLFPDVPAAVEVARSLGFERKRTLVRMALRPEAALSGRPERMFGAAGFEYG